MVQNLFSRETIESIIWRYLNVSKYYLRHCKVFFFKQGKTIERTFMLTATHVEITFFNMTKLPNEV
jgi:hypothetical protein